MAEVQTHTESGEMTQRFIEFVMMQAQNAAFMLGQIPHPQTGKGEVNLGMAKLFIDQLVMIRAKTNGNLNHEELAVLNNAISNLQMVFFEASQGRGDAAHGHAEQPGELEENDEAPDGSAVSSEQAESAAQPEASSSSSEGESKKKFTKSYGS